MRVLLRNFCTASTGARQTRSCCCLCSSSYFSSQVWNTVAHSLTEAEAVSLMLIPFFKDAYVLALLSFIFGLGMGGGGPIITMLMFARSAQGRSGEGLGLKITVNHLTKMVSPLVFGAMGSALGLLPMFVFNALLMVGGGYLSRPNKPRSRSVDDAKSTK